jgi:uncharacterized protein YukE
MIIENLNLFFSRIKELTFWQRIFSWRSIRYLSYDAFEEYKSLQKQINQKHQEYDLLEKKLIQAETKNEGLLDSSDQYEKTVRNKDEEIIVLNHKTEYLNRRNSELENSVSKFESNEEQRIKNYDNKISQLNQLKETLENEIKRINDERVAAQKEAFDKMKSQWLEHEISVQQTLKMICRNHLIKYVQDVPFRGNPDNTLEICDEYIIFDAKCPSNDDLANFPKYIKAQTESVKKYAYQERVKKDIFLVVPTNTIHTIKQLTYHMGDYHVYIITKDSLEPVILSLKKIENYEFVNQLSPEERDSICRIIGRFAHTTKRKIQIDQFFATEFLDLLVKCQNDLPDDILKQVIEFENAEKLNPPAEKKSRQILTSDLLQKHEMINAEAGIRNVVIPINFEEIKNLE